MVENKEVLQRPQKDLKLLSQMSEQAGDAGVPATEGS